MILSHNEKEEKVYMGTAETFGRQWQVGDVVGTFLDLLDRTISKYKFDILFHYKIGYKKIFISHTRILIHYCLC